MPVGWIGFSTGSSPFVRGRRDPEKLRDDVKALIANTGAKLIGDVYFENYRERAYILVEGLDKWDDAKAVTRILGADEYTKLVKAPLAKRARGREREIKPKPPKKP
jgi:hypothetical protein